MAFPIPPLIFPRARSERKPARSVPPLIFPSPAKGTPQLVTTDLTTSTPVGQRRQATENDARIFHQPYHDDSYANGKVSSKKNDLSPEKRKSSHLKRKNAGSESASIQAKRIHRRLDPFYGRLESFARDKGREDCDDENNSSTLQCQDEAVDSFGTEQPQRLQRPVAGKDDGFSDRIAVSRQPSAESQNNPRTRRKSQQASPHARADQPKLRSTSNMRSKHSRGSSGGGTNSPPVESQTDRRGCSPSEVTLNEFKTADLANMVEREVQRQLAQIEARMLTEIDRRLEGLVRFQWDARTKEGRESSERKTSVKEQRRRQE